MSLATAEDVPNPSTHLGYTIGTHRISVALLGPIIVVVISLLRSPAVFSHGHLWAEEAFFLTHTLSADDFLSRFFFVYNGHFELLNSIVFAVATSLKLKMVPLLTTYSGLSIECVLAYAVVFFRRDLEIGLVPALSISVLIVVSPCAAEHQFNILNNVWLTSAIMVLMINLPPGCLEGHGVKVGASTLVMGLSGIPAACLLPIAALHALAWRSRPHLLLAGMLALCVLVQGTLVLTHGTHDRFGPVSPWVYLAAPYFHVVLEHLLGVEAASALSHWFEQAMPAPGTVLSLMMAPLALLGWLIAHVVRSGDSRSRLLLVSFIYVVVFNIAFAIGDRNDLFSIYDMRYFFVPSFIVALFIARIASLSTPSRSRPILAFMLFLTILSARDYLRGGYNDMYVTNQRDWRPAIDGCRVEGGPCRIEIDPGGYYVVDVPEKALR